jgi:hypothetical protein
MIPQISRYALLGALLFSNFPATAQTPSTTLPLSAPNRVLGPSGLRREAGNWLFNDSIFVSRGPNLASKATSPFLPNLRRDKKNKLPLWMPVATREVAGNGLLSGFYASNLGESPRAYLQWSTLELPTLREMSRPDFDFVALQTRLTAQAAEARTRGQVFVGWSLPTGNQMAKIALQPISAASAMPIIKRLRTVLDAISPESALILELSGNGSTTTNISDLDAVAPWCDVVVLHANIDSDDDLWALKMARRVAEEQKEFDLPIFVVPRTLPNTLVDGKGSEARLAQFFMGGVTGFIMPSEQTPAWARVVSRNPGLFAGAVTLEDAAILPSQNPQTLRIAADLRSAGRVPLVGRLPLTQENARGESLLAVLDDATTLETLNGLDRAARAGSAIYLEGLPNLKNLAIAAKIAEMTSASLELLPVPKSEMLALDDPWLFGDARGRELEVEQRVKWTIKTSLAGQTRIKKGEDTLTPYAAARLATDANGLLMTSLGRGRLIWLPHAPTQKSNPMVRRAFTAAIAGSLQGGLVNWKWNSVEEEVQNGGQLRVAMRASKTGTPIIGLWNDAISDAKIKLEARGDSPVALDLLSEREIPATVIGYGSNVNITVPAKGFIWLAFGKNRAAIDKERLAPRPKARTK